MVMHVCMQPLACKAQLEARLSCKWWPKLRMQSCLTLMAQLEVTVQATSGPSTMVPVDKPSAGSELGVLAPHPQAGDLPPIGLSLRKSESLLDLVNQHLACVQG